MARNTSPKRLAHQRHTQVGQPHIAIEHIDAALGLSPRARIGSSLSVIGHAHFFSRCFADAVPKLLLAIHEDPSGALPYRIPAACYAHMGQLDDAREIVHILMKSPNFMAGTALMLWAG